MFIFGNWTRTSQLAKHQHFGCIWLQIIDSLWKNDTDYVEILRGWMVDHYVVATSLEMNGENSHVHNSGGLYFDIRLSFYTNLKYSGVDRLAESTHEESLAETISNGWHICEMRY